MMEPRQTYTDEDGRPAIVVSEHGFYVVLKVEVIPTEILNDGTVASVTRFVDKNGGSWSVKVRRLIEGRPHKKRRANSPVGPEWGNGKPICHGPVGASANGLPTCGHKWSDHDDDGCLWEDCDCKLPGERK